MGIDASRGFELINNKNNAKACKSERIFSNNSQRKWRVEAEQHMCAKQTSECDELCRDPNHATQMEDDF